MAKALFVTDSYGTHRYTVTKETPEIIAVSDVTVLEGYPLRFNRREKRMEVHNGAGWDVYISDSSIRQVDIVNE